MCLKYRRHFIAEMFQQKFLSVIDIRDSPELNLAGQAYFLLLTRMFHTDNFEASILYYGKMLIKHYGHLVRLYDYADSHTISLLA